MGNVVLGIVDVGKDLLNGIGFIVKTINMQISTTSNGWELGFVRFLGIYTLGAMFLPLPAYLTMFYSLLKQQSFRPRYLLVSIFLCPFSVIIRYQI